MTKKKGPTRGPYNVERNDNEDGSIAYEIWSHPGPGDINRVVRISDDDNKNAKADAELICDLLNAHHIKHARAGSRYD